jgi:hypothetical protein
MRRFEQTTRFLIFWSDLRNEGRSPYCEIVVRVFRRFPELIDISRDFPTSSVDFHVFPTSAGHSVNVCVCVCVCCIKY